MYDRMQPFQPTFVREEKALLNLPTEETFSHEFCSFSLHYKMSENALHSVCCDGLVKNYWFSWKLVTIL